MTELIEVGHILRDGTEPVCMSCWPSLVVADYTNPATGYPCCLECLHKNAVPTMPRFIIRRWEDHHQ